MTSELIQLAKARNISQLVSNGEDVYLLLDGEESDESRLIIGALVVLGYLILNEPTPAQHVLTRLPSRLRTHPLAKTLFDLVASISMRRYENIYARASNLASTIESAYSIPTGAAEALKLLTTQFIESFRDLMLSTLSRAYINLPVMQAGIYLGIPEGDVLSFIQDAGWAYNAIEGTVAPPQPTYNAYANEFGGLIDTQTLVSSLSTFNRVANASTALELLTR